MGKIADQEYWQRYKESLYITKRLKTELDGTIAPCPTCGQPQSRLKESKLYMNEWVCGYCFEDLSHGQLPQRRK